MKKTLLASALLVVLSGCTESPGRLVLSDSVAIRGGTASLADSKAASTTVMLWQIGEEGFSGSCTATLIDRRFLVTAAHCVPENHKGAKMAAAFTRDALQDMQQGRDFSEWLIPVSGYRSHPSYNYRNNALSASSVDIAVVELASDAPASYSLRAMPAAEDIGDYSAVVLTGFGRTDDPKIKFKLHEVEVEKQLESDDFMGIFALESQDKQICFGDSGGPVFVKMSDGSLKWIGINSAVESEACNSWSFFTDLRKHRSFVISAVQELRIEQDGSLEK